MRKRVMVALAVSTVAVVGSRVLAAILNNRETTEELVKRVWEENKDFIVKDLGLKQVPVLQFDDSQPEAVMYTKHFITYKGDMFEKTIVDTEPDYIIHVNLKAVKDLLKQYNIMTLYNKQASITALKQLFLHESRHIWQAQEDFYVNRVVKAFSFEFNKGYGKAPEERDANEYAIKRAANRRERVLFELQKMSQENIDVFYCNERERSRQIRTHKAFMRQWNPVLALFL